MTDNLSEKLCKICGVKPSYYFVAENPQSYTSQAIKKYIYPNFEVPENFVKLLELKIDEDTISKLVTLEIPYITDSRDFLECLCAYINTYTNSYQVKQIKQAIKNTEWKY